MIMKVNNKKTFLFDLGNTLIFREKSHLDFDIELVLNYFPELTKKGIANVIESVSKSYPEMYDHSITGSQFNSLESEDKFVRNFFKEVFTLLGNTKVLEDFDTERKNQMRYISYPGVTDLLTQLQETYELGILTNGRPSRRRVLSLLKLDSYFNQNFFFISDELGKAKPYTDVFVHVSNILKGREICLIDDEQRNIDAAKRFGWQTIHVTESCERNKLFTMNKRI